MLYTIYYILYTIYYILSTNYNLLSTIYYILYTIYYILYRRLGGKERQRPQPGNRVSCLCLRCVRACVTRREISVVYLDMSL